MGKNQRNSRNTTKTRKKRSDFSCVLCRVRIEFLLTARCTEIIFLPFVFADELCSLLIDGHLTDRIDCHFLQYLSHLPFFASGIYFVSSSDRVTTVTELAAIARAASSGRNVMPNEG